MTEERVMRESHLNFPGDFMWGAATAAYQIEGGIHEGGRGESIWDRFAATPGKVRNGESGAVAADHFHRYREDVALMRDLGLRAYRLSMAWPRVIPDGRGAINTAGLDFYDRLVDELLRAGIEPYITLYHWDLPQRLEDEGGWLNRATIDAYEKYVTVVVNRLGDRVTHWITHNEPQVVAHSGYGHGEHAPGRRDGLTGALAVSHHLLLSHGRAVRIIRDAVPDAEIGIVLNLHHVDPASDDESDRQAACFADGMQNRWYLDPVFRGRYPGDIAQEWEHHLPPIEPGDMETIAAPLDCLGINYYSRHVVRSGEDGSVQQIKPANAEYTSMGWEVYPRGLEQLLLRVARDYQPARIYITENGAAYTDVRTHDGAIHDPERQQYIAQHLAAARRAWARGAPLAGYFVWSLLDNFEWAHGYSRRFGIVYVDYPTLERIPKDSAYWYRDFIRAQISRAGIPAAE